MSDNMEKAIDGALREIVNAPVRADEALVERVRKASEHAAKARRRAALWVAGAGLLINAALASALVLTVVSRLGGGWLAAAAALMGLTLATLPAVPLLAIGEIPAFMYGKRKIGMEK